MCYLICNKKRKGVRHIKYFLSKEGRGWRFIETFFPYVFLDWKSGKLTDQDLTTELQNTKVTLTV